MPRKEPEARTAYNKAYYGENADRIKEREMNKYWRDHETIVARRKTLRTPEYKARERERMRLSYAALRAEIVAAYGGVCSCCGEAEPKFLELDHTNGDGAEHRRKIGRGSGPLYCYVQRLGFPQEGFRLLCANCNQGRARNGGVCPHDSLSPGAR